MTITGFEDLPTVSWALQVVVFTAVVKYFATDMARYNATGPVVPLNPVKPVILTDFR